MHMATEMDAKLRAMMQEFNRLLEKLRFRKELVALKMDKQMQELEEMEKEFDEFKNYMKPFYDSLAPLRKKATTCEERIDVTKLQALTDINQKVPADKMTQTAEFH